MRYAPEFELVWIQKQNWYTDSHFSSCLVQTSVMRWTPVIETTLKKNDFFYKDNEYFDISYGIISVIT